VVGGARPTVQREARPSGREPAPGSAIKERQLPAGTAQTYQLQTAPKKRSQDPASSSSSTAKPRAN
jgi:hypothetical protein